MWQVGQVATSRWTGSARLVRARVAASRGQGRDAAVGGQVGSPETPVAGEPLARRVVVGIVRCQAVGPSHRRRVSRTDTALGVDAQRGQQRLIAVGALIGHPAEHVADPVLQELPGPDAGARLHLGREFLVGDDTVIPPGGIEQDVASHRRPRVASHLGADLGCLAPRAADHGRIVARLADLEPERPQHLRRAAPAAGELRRPRGDARGILLRHPEDRLRVVCPAVVPEHVVASPAESVSGEEIVGAALVVLRERLEHVIARDRVEVRHGADATRNAGHYRRGAVKRAGAPHVRGARPGLRPDLSRGRSRPAAVRPRRSCR